MTNNSFFAATAFLGLSACMSSVETATQNAVAGNPDFAFAPVYASFESAGERAMQIYLTGYSFWDNTPPGSAQIARPVIHRQAGGTGTYHDPITVAVGHSKSGGQSRMDFPAGTRFYFPNLQKYGIVEDLCGDGPQPQNGPCHSGYSGLAWLDIYVGGHSTSAAVANRCMNAITGVQNVIVNPSPSRPVFPGEIVSSTCRGST